MSEHHFYDKPIIRSREQQKIKELLEEFKECAPDESLKEKIWEKLQKARHEGVLSIPFKVVLRQASTPSSKRSIEVILDTKV